MQHDQAVTITLQDLISLAKKAKELPVRAIKAKSQNAGGHLSRLMGRGMEFAETRQYFAGDDIRTIDWRVTARTGKPHTKLFAAEKERQIYVCVDMRRPMFFATQGVFKSVQAAKLAALVAWQGVHQGDKIGGVIFNNEGTIECKPARGKQGALPFLQALSEQAAFSYEKMAHHEIALMDDAVNHLKRVTRPGSLVFIVSDFRKANAEVQDHIYNIATHSDVVLCHIFDRVEASLPESCVLPITNGNKVFEIDSSIKSAHTTYKNNFLSRKEAFKTLSHHPHIHFLSCSTEDDCFEILKV